MAAETFKNFIARIRTVGVPTGSHFYVEFIGSPDVNSKTVGMMVEQAALPGITSMTQEYRSFGEITESPYGITYPPVRLTVLIDNKMVPNNYFRVWSNEVYDQTSRTSGYYNKFVRDVRISLLDKNSKPIYQLLLKEAYPKHIEDVQLDFASKDVIKLSVLLVYKYWQMEDSSAAKKITSGRSSNSQNTGATPDGLGVVSAASGAFDFGDPSAVGGALGQFGPEMGASLGRSASVVSSKLVGSAMSGADTLTRELTDLSGDFVNLGRGVGDLGKNLTAITAPVSVISGAVSSMSGTLGSIDSTLSALGLGSPFSKIRTNLNTTSAALGTVAALKGVPGHLGTIGANVIAMGGQFDKVSKTIVQIPGATSSLKNSLSRLGENLNRKGSDISNGANNLQTYSNSAP